MGGASTYRKLLLGKGSVSNTYQSIDTSTLLHNNSSFLAITATWHMSVPIMRTDERILTLTLFFFFFFLDGTTVHCRPSPS